MQVVFVASDGVFPQVARGASRHVNASVESSVQRLDGPLKFACFGSSAPIQPSVFDSCPAFDKGSGRVKIVSVRGPTKEEALAFLDKEDLLKVDDDDIMRAKLMQVAELVGDRFTSLKDIAAAARGVTVTQQGAFLIRVRRCRSVPPRVCSR